MIITVKNKSIIPYVDDTNKQLSSNIELENTSINFANNLTFLSLHNTTHTITNFSVSVSDNNFKIAYRDGLNSNFIETTTATDTEIKVSDNGGKQIRKWNIYILTENEGVYSTTMTVSYTLNGTNFTYSFNIQCNVIGIDSKYILLSQNFKFAITDDYYRAFKDSEHKSSGTDERLMNEKRKEFLLSYFDLNAQVGTYHTLLSALHYFGYGELLEIRELWKNENNFRQTTKITSEVLDHIDNRLLGFKKTNQLQLIYQINKEDGTIDTDGFNNYINVLFDTEEMLIKMYALKRVLEKDFLPLNTKIVDIIGEHTSTLGVDTKVWLNDQRIDEVDLNNQNDNAFTFELLQKDIQINEHEILLKNKHFIINAGLPDTAEYPSGTTDSDLLDNIYFEIEKELIYDISSTDALTDVFNDTEYVEKYDRSDFGLVKIKLDVDTALYNRFKYEIYEPSISQTIPQFTTPLYNINTLPIDKTLLFGIRKLGTFKIVVYLFDNYGGVTIMNPNNQTFTISNIHTDFKLAKIDRSNNGKDKSLDFWSTFQTNLITDRIVEIDCFDSTLNINTFDESTHTNKVLRYMSSKYDLRTLQMNTFQFNNVPLNELWNTTLYDYGYEYGRYIIDLIGDGTSGDRTIKMKLFEHHDYDEITLNYNSTTYPTKEEFYNEFITLFNNKVGVYNRFTIQLQYFSNDGIIANNEAVIRIVAKEGGESISNVFFDASQINTYNPIVNIAEDYYTIMPLSGYIRIKPKLGGLTDDLKVNGVVVSNLIISSLNDLESALKTHFTNNNIKASIFKYTNDIIISTRVPLTIEHSSFGKFIEVARGSESSNLKVVSSGDTFYKGEPFYAYIDTKSKIDNIDCVWTLKNSLNGDIIDIQKSLVYRHILVTQGSYTLELKTTDKFGTNTKVKNGFVVIQ